MMQYAIGRQPGIGQLKNNPFMSRLVIANAISSACIGSPRRSYEPITCNYRLTAHARDTD